MPRSQTRESLDFGPKPHCFGYGLMAAAALIFVLLFIPETKGKTLEELEGILMRREKSGDTARA